MNDAHRPPRPEAALRRAEEDLRSLQAEIERLRSRNAELESANAFLTSIFQHIPYMVIVKTASDLRLVHVSPVFERLMGLNQQQLLGKTTYELARSPEEAEIFIAQDRQALALGRELDIPDETVHTRDGSELVVHMKKIPIFDETGQPRFLLTMGEDITERKRREQEIQRLNATLAQRTTEVEAANRAKGTFLATMSHEIRTPMNGMIGMLELLSLSELNPEQRETLQLVRESSRSLLRIIDDILDFSKIEAGKLEVRPEVVSIKQVIEEVHSIYLGNASSKGLIVHRIVDPRISPALLVDPVRLRQILNNFVSNAIKFTPSGWIDISAQWEGRENGVEHLRFVVKDSGIGISPEDQQRLFQPFSQASGDEARRSASGTGLGLVISRQLAQMMGGTITMTSERGKGTTMTLCLSLPVAEPASSPSTGATARASVPSSPTRRTAPSVAQAEAEGTLVLLVDDHPVNRMLLLRQVQTLGYAAETAENGVEALEMWKSGRFRLVITDCHMPEMDGYELARSIRQLESDTARKRVPIVACTANALQGETEACLAAGMDDCLVKPVELPQLLQKLDQWLPIPQQPASKTA
jgi:PAS domain S-box-containing protein